MQHIKECNLNDISPSYKNIFLFWESNGLEKNRHEITKTALWTVSKLNPERKVYILSNTLNPSDIAHKDMSVYIVRWDWDSLCADTPLETDVLGRRVYEEVTWNGRVICDVLRALLLYKFGGTYMDTDNVAIKELPDTQKNIVSRCYDPADAHWNGLVDSKSGEANLSEEELLEVLFPGTLRENNEHPDLKFFIRFDGWTNWEPKHLLFTRMLQRNIVTEAPQHGWQVHHFSYGTNAEAYAPPTWLYKTIMDHREELAGTFTFGLCLHYLYEVFMNRDWGVTHGQGELLDEYYSIIPDFDGKSETLHGEDREGLQWGTGMQVSRTISEKFLERLTSKKWPFASMLWMADKEQNPELVEVPKTTARISSWIYHIMREKTGY